MQITAVKFLVEKVKKVAAVGKIRFGWSVSSGFLQEFLPILNPGSFCLLPQFLPGLLSVVLMISSRVSPWTSSGVSHGVSVQIFSGISSRGYTGITTRVSRKKQ